MTLQPILARPENIEQKEAVDPYSLISAESLQAKFDVSLMTLHRWAARPELDFPKPIYIGKRRFWFEAQVNEWIANRAREQRGASGCDHAEKIWGAA